MTKVELIKLIGEILREVDAVGRLQPPNDFTRVVLDELRATLAKQQLRMAIHHVDQNTPVFHEATREIELMGAELRQAVGSTEQKTIRVDALRRFVKAVGTLANPPERF